MASFAKFVAKELDLDLADIKNYAETTDRYAVFKAGPVLSVSVSSFRLGSKPVYIQVI